MKKPLAPEKSIFLIEPLTQRHDKASFHCGVDALDRYLKEQAGQERKKHIAAPFVLIDSEKNRIAGYYTLSMSSILLQDLPPETVKKLPRYPALPAVLLGRLAVDSAYQGRKIGEMLLVDALHRAYNNPIAAAFVLVDALNEPVKAFYARYGFQSFSHQQQRLFLPMKTLGQVIN